MKDYSKIIEELEAGIDWASLEPLEDDRAVQVRLDALAHLAELHRQAADKYDRERLQLGRLAGVA
jgi:hypothetical protein